ncbi:MAG: hypothetical protein KKC11_05050 [Candidatus Omnitrophica bacterium]|nr:hypothetical protein [Candidatus Omnitrophota bacterium]MBU1133800.1 hypothetical protein [Candidatus Omnitrophota bacterium]MBU2505036.1 hypothetical protein [Candidatus Omnitrophota bacterium]
MSVLKEEAKKMINRLPDDATWDDLMYELYITKKVQVALDAIEKGKIAPHEEVKRKFLSQ